MLDPIWTIHEIRRRYIGKPDFADSLHEYKLAVSSLQDAARDIYYIAFIGVNHPKPRTRPGIYGSAAVCRPTRC